MEARVQKWGNSLALRIPKAFAIEAGIQQGSPVSISVQNGEIVVKPLQVPRYDLDELIAGITADNVHPETDWGDDVGRERWWVEAE